MAPTTAEEPAAKKAKVDTEKTEEPEVPKEPESDAAKDSRPMLKQTIGFDPADFTLNVIPTIGGKLMTAMADGGMQFLVAGARANTGVKKGRYMFETKVVESLNPSDGHTGRGKGPASRQMVRVGFSIKGSSLYLGDSADSICFDAEGFFQNEGQRAAVPIFKGAKTPTSRTASFGRDTVVGILLNLDDKSANAHTVSLFKDGERVSEPIPLPDCLKGKPLFPHVGFRNVTLQVHFGPSPLKPLSFKCRTVQGAAKDDMQVVENAPKTGKYDVLFPVGFPNEGTFDWLDDFVKKNPQYVELSDRKIIEWAQKSGLTKPKGGWRNSNDKPEFNFGIYAMDDMSVRRAVYSLAPLVPRHYIVMEVKSNLVAEERKELLSKFQAPCFKKTAKVVLGTPNAEWKAKVHETLLEEKQLKANAAWNAKKAELERQKALALRQKQMEEAKKKMEEEKRAKEEEDRKKEEGEAKADEGVAADEKVSEAKDTEMKADDTKEDEPEEAEPPKAELTEEEKKLNFLPHSVPDLTPAVMNQFMRKFSLPEKSEGFDQLKFEWQGQTESAEYLKERLQDMKTLARLESLQPGKVFTDKLAAWRTSIEEWNGLQRDFQAKQQSAKKDKKEGEEDAEEEEVKGCDIFSVENVCDVGGGEPLFANFQPEDWKLFELRYEMYLLFHGFKKDVEDDAHPGIHETLLVYYYGKYFKKQINVKNYGKETNKEMLELVKDTMAIDDKNMVVCLKGEDLETPEMFLKLTEETRRERQRRIDAGDETARLKFTPMLYKPQPAPQGEGGDYSDNQHHGHHRSWHGGKGGKGWGKSGGYRPYGKGWGK